MAGILRIAASLALMVLVFAAVIYAAGALGVGFLLLAESIRSPIVSLVVSIPVAVVSVWGLALGARESIEMAESLCERIAPELAQLKSPGKLACSVVGFIGFGTLFYLLSTLLPNPIPSAVAWIVTVSSAGSGALRALRYARDRRDAVRPGRAREESGRR